MAGREETYRQGKRKAQVLAFVKDAIKREGIAPSYGMICEALRIGTRTEVCRYVRWLEQDGKLKRAGQGKVRRIRLLDTAHLQAD